MSEINKQNIGKLFDVAEKYRPSGRPIITGEDDFDKAMDGGVRGGELITISGGSGKGKTSWALWLTKRIVDSGVPCLWFTYEMNPWYLKEKLVKLGANEELAMFVPFNQEEAAYPWIKKIITEAVKEQNCGIVFIDHLHYLLPKFFEFTGESITRPAAQANTALLIGGIARALKQLAIELDITIYLIAHSKRVNKDEKYSADTIRDSALVSNESDYVYIVDRLKKKEKKGRNYEERMEAGEMQVEEEFTNISKVTLDKNRRTGDLIHRLFQVIDSKFDPVDKDKYKDYE